MKRRNFAKLHSHNLSNKVSPHPTIDVACDDPICVVSQKRKGKTDDTLASDPLGEKLSLTSHFSRGCGKGNYPAAVAEKDGDCRIWVHNAGTPTLGLTQNGDKGAFRYYGHKRCRV